MGSLRSRSPSYRPTILPAEPEPKVSVTITEQDGPEEPEEDAEQDLVSDGLGEGDLLPINSSCFITELNLKDVCEEELAEEDSSSSQSEEKDTPGELATVSASMAGEGGSSLQGSYVDGTLPDLIKSGRPLGRRRTLGHVSETVG